jgi:hypothetical protein
VSRYAQLNKMSPKGFWQGRVRDSVIEVRVSNVQKTYRDVIDRHGNGGKRPSPTMRIFSNIGKNDFKKQPSYFIVGDNTVLLARDHGVLHVSLFA